MQAGLGEQADQMIVAREGDDLADPTVDSKILALKSSGADMLLMGGIPGR